MYASGNAVDAADKVHWLVVREGKPAGFVSDNFQLASGVLPDGRIALIRCLTV